ncbi:uncharacterized protein C8Q71DRAFT_752375 [Rhodofomes roseus]|uniref:DUF4139 domain-containing protein n=1 Tax=Rhodofomes roseus TaxID=34475 RepID=A0ABQ8KLS5_9APHY|nr:uncharacterized protein C8Q71DRAFT_752375 [Rhodofomes roseus]KAH9838660.1 hypothetical protein C8Q71DRAFT_752375 [Rhodofomes roseus]
MTIIQFNASLQSIKAVTVYRKAAEVVRTFTLDLQPGRITAHVTQLSSSIDDKSLRVSHLSGSTRVLDVQYTVAASNAVMPVDDSDARHALLLRKRELEDERKVQDQGLSLFVDYARTLNSAHTAPGDAVNFLDAFMAGRRSTVASIRKLDDEIAEIDRALNAENNKSTGKGGTDGRVTIDILASEACSVELSITYKVDAAGWKPYYELHATTVKGQPASTVSLHYNVRVKQTSGEDWTDANFVFVSADEPSQGVDADVPSLAARKAKCIPLFGGYGDVSATSGAAPAGGSSFDSSPNRGLIGAPFAAPSGGGGLFGSTGSTSGFGAFGTVANAIAQQHEGGNDPPPARAAGDGPTPHPFTTWGVFSPQAPATNLGPQASGGLFGRSSPAAAVSGGGIFGSRIPDPATNAASASASAFVARPAHTTTDVATTPGLSSKAVPAVKPQIDDGTAGRGISTGIVPNMRVTALGEKIVLRESGLRDDVRLSAEERASIPSDGVGHAVPIASLVLNAAFAWVCVPRSRVAVFVECRSRNTSAHTLVAGPLAVYVDGKQVAKTTLKDIKPQDKIVAPLGVDDAVRVMHRRTASTEEQPERPFVERLWTTACTARYAVTNGHTFAIPKFVLRDALPVSANPQIAITVKAVREKDPNAAGVNSGFDLGSGQEGGVLGENVREADGREGEGIFEWERRVEAGHTDVLQAEWEVSTPAGISWEETAVMKPFWGNNH